MALFKCPNCGKEYSDHLYVCPSCGTNRLSPPRIRKKGNRIYLFIIGILGVIAISIFGLLSSGLQRGDINVQKKAVSFAVKNEIVGEKIVDSMQEELDQVVNGLKWFWEENYEYGKGYYLGRGIYLDARDAQKSIDEFKENTIKYLPEVKSMLLSDDIEKQEFLLFLGSYTDFWDKDSSLSDFRSNQEYYNDYFYDHLLNYDYSFCHGYDKDTILKSLAEYFDGRTLINIGIPEIESVEKIKIDGTKCWKVDVKNEGSYIVDNYYGFDDKASYTIQHVGESSEIDQSSLGFCEADVDHSVSESDFKDEEICLVGKIDNKYDIHMTINIPRRTGYYYYDSKGPDNKLRLKITETSEAIGAIYLTIEEFDVDGNNTGKFGGTFNGAFYIGTFTTRGKSMSLELSTVE